MNLSKRQLQVLSLGLGLLAIVMVLGNIIFGAANIGAVFELGSVKGRIEDVDEIMDDAPDIDLAAREEDLLAACGKAQIQLVALGPWHRGSLDTGATSVDLGNELVRHSQAVKSRLENNGVKLLGDARLGLGDHARVESAERFACLKAQSAALVDVLARHRGSDVVRLRPTEKRQTHLLQGHRWQRWELRLLVPAEVIPQLLAELEGDRVAGRPPRCPQFAVVRHAEVYAAPDEPDGQRLRLWLLVDLYEFPPPEDVVGHYHRESR